jgi:hypothetical protein
LTNELCNQPFKDDFIAVERELEHGVIFFALVSLHKNLSVCDLSGTYNTAVRAMWL